MCKSVCMSSMRAMGRFGRVGWRRIAVALGTALIFSLVPFDGPAQAQGQAQPQTQRAPNRGELSMSTAGGFARHVIRLDGEMDAEVKVSSGVLIVQFKQPVNVPMDRATNGASQYFGAARRDPDGK